MNISDLKLPDPVKDIFRRDGIEQLNEPQSMAIKKGLLDGKNLVIASPTASGKTFIAELAILRNFLNNKKSIYLVPLKALASEKHEEFTRKYKSLGMRVAISTGDFDSGDDWLGSYDVIILSNEKMDSLLRHNKPWIRDITLIIVDEIHLMNDATRGPTLEVVLTKLRRITNSQVIALSATIQNADEIAKWLKAKLVYSEYRPIDLRKGVFYPNENEYVLDFQDSKKTLAKSKLDDELTICMDTLGRGKQALIFVSSRRSAESTAEKISLTLRNALTEDEKKQLEDLANEAENTLSNPTKQCRRLGKIIRGGMAFHHAGLLPKQRKLIEDSFKSGMIKFIVSTPTLAWGINLPAFRVLIRDAKRFDSENYGSYYIPNFEVQQMMGRAGRPKYDKEGEAIIMAKNSKDAADLRERYILGELEPIYSKLSVETVLRIHVLGLIASETTRTRSELQDFFGQTFFAYQYGDIGEVMEKVEKILEELRSWKFIAGEEGGFISSEFRPAFELANDIALKATRIGKRIAELYIDPRSAKHIIDNIDANNDLGYLTIINECSEMIPLLRAKKADQLDEKIVDMKIKVPDVWDIEYEDFLDAFKTALMFRDWTNEIGEDALLDKYAITPGELYTKSLNMEWMLYSARELAILLNKREIANAINKLRLRVKYGIKEELLPLIELRGIGRARARILWKAGIKNPPDILKSIPKISSLLGPKIAQELVTQLTENREDKFRRVKSRR